MAAALSLSPSTPLQYETATVNLTGAANSTAHVITLTFSDGSSVKAPVTTDGSGAASYQFVPQVNGSITTTAALAAPATLATVTTTADGS